MVPKLRAAGFIEKMDDVMDSIKLGQLMLYSDELIKYRRHPGVVVEEYSHAWKYPSYLDYDAPVFSYDGVYVIKKPESDRKQTLMYLGLVVFILFFFLFNKLWPMWLRVATWQGFVGSILGYFVMILVRLLIKVVGFHLGLDVQLFPNFLKSFYLIAPRNTLWPVVSVQMRDDAFSPVIAVFRVMSMLLVVHTLYDFAQDEKKLEDLQEFTTSAQNLFDYS